MLNQHKIQMVDLKGQYNRVREEVDAAIASCISNAVFINGPEVHAFKQSLSAYMDDVHVIPVANGTDALQIAMMALDLKPGDEVIVPAFTYVATAEVIALLGLTPVWVDVNPDTFNIDVEQLVKAITPKTRAIVPVHLYGQCADMDAVMQIAQAHNLFVIEDTAQAIGATFTTHDGKTYKAGTIGHIGCTSFFPSKNLGCYGDGGAMFTKDAELAKRIQMIANHGQEKKYYHDIIGVNSRLDSLQAAILNVKLKYLNDYANARNKAAAFYDDALSGIATIKTPYRVRNSSHVFHQYTLIVMDGSRDALKKHLDSQGVPTMIYYPVPMHLQKGYSSELYPVGSFPVAEALCNQVISLPMHTELTTSELEFITQTIKDFYN